MQRDNVEGGLIWTRLGTTHLNLENVGQARWCTSCTESRLKKCFFNVGFRHELQACLMAEQTLQPLFLCILPHPPKQFLNPEQVTPVQRYLEFENTPPPLGPS